MKRFASAIERLSSVTSWFTWASTFATSPLRPATARALRLCLRNSTGRASAGAPIETRFGALHRADHLVVASARLLHLLLALRTKIGARVLRELGLPFLEQRLTDAVDVAHPLLDIGCRCLAVLELVGKAIVLGLQIAAVVADDLAKALSASVISSFASCCESRADSTRLARMSRLA